MIYGGNFNIYLNVIISDNLPIFNIFPKIVWKKKLHHILTPFPYFIYFFLIGFPEWKLPTFAYPYPFWLAPIPPPPQRRDVPSGTALDVTRKFTHAAPVPWPSSVTLVGSPPKTAMFSWIQCRAAIWSMSP